MLLSARSALPSDPHSIIVLTTGKLPARGLLGVVGWVGVGVGVSKCGWVGHEVMRGLLISTNSGVIGCTGSEYKAWVQGVSTCT